MCIRDRNLGSEGFDNVNRIYRSKPDTNEIQFGTNEASAGATCPKPSHEGDFVHLAAVQVSKRQSRSKCRRVSLAEFDRSRSRESGLVCLAGSYWHQLLAKARLQKVWKAKDPFFGI